MISMKELVEYVFPVKKVFYKYYPHYSGGATKLAFLKIGGWFTYPSTIQIAKFQGKNEDIINVKVNVKVLNGVIHIND
jgi:hypothetical protein